MSLELNKTRIAWYKTPLSRESLAALNERSDWKGLFQVLGHLGLLVLTGTAAWYAAERLPGPILVLILFVYGTIFSFLGAAFHELCHQTVFKTRTLSSSFCTGT
jgi:fatty acid desaturase